MSAWVRSRHSGKSARCPLFPQKQPLFPQKQTFVRANGTSAMLADIGRRREQGKSGFRFSFPHYFLRDPLGDYLL
jgi:hypothetical protein